QTLHIRLLSCRCQGQPNAETPTQCDAAHASSAHGSSSGKPLMRHRCSRCLIVYALAGGTPRLFCGFFLWRGGKKWLKFAANGERAVSGQWRTAAGGIDHSADAGGCQLLDEIGMRRVSLPLAANLRQAIGAKFEFRTKTAEDWRFVVIGFVVIS